MTQVTIIGNAGGGKSTLSREPGRALKIDLLPMDRLYLAAEMALRLGYSYPAALDEQITHYVQELYAEDDLSE